MRKKTKLVSKKKKATKAKKPKAGTRTRIIYRTKRVECKPEAEWMTFARGWDQGYEECRRQYNAQYLEEELERRRSPEYQALIKTKDESTFHFFKKDE